MKNGNSRRAGITIRTIIIIISSMQLLISNLCSQSSAIILYGCSSAGKTSISKELGRVLPGKWKVLGIDMFSNRDNTANALFWQQANKDLSAGYNVILDTVFPDFLIDRSKGYKTFTVLTYCSPQVLVEHVKRRNTNGVDHDRRTLKKVLEQYCHKYRAAVSKDYAIDEIQKSDVEAVTDWRARRKIKEKFFKNNCQTVYIASKLYQYDIFINTGKMPISSCAKKIKDVFIESEKNQ